MSDCCEPGCSAEVLCPVHQVLADLKAKVEGLEWRWDREDMDQCVVRNEVLALFEEGQHV